MQYKSSKQRNMILDYMKDLTVHVSAEEIYSNINQDGNKISLATVYRNLNILEDTRQIKKIPLPDDGYVYDKTCNPHYHFYCNICKTLYDLDLNYNTAMDQSIQDADVGRIDSHEITFRGVCKNCN